MVEMQRIGPGLPCWTEIGDTMQYGLRVEMRCNVQEPILICRSLRHQTLDFIVAGQRLGRQAGEELSLDCARKSGQKCYTPGQCRLELLETCRGSCSGAVVKVQHNSQCRLPAPRPVPPVHYCTKCLRLHNFTEGRWVKRPQFFVCNFQHVQLARASKFWTTRIVTW